MKAKVKSKRQNNFFICVYLCSSAVTVLLHRMTGPSRTKRDARGRLRSSARIVPVSGPAIENGTVVIQNGKIAAVGANVSVPSGAERIDGKGLTVFPGMIDAGTNMGLAEITLAVPGSVDLAEVGEYEFECQGDQGHSSSFRPHQRHTHQRHHDGPLVANGRHYSGPGGAHKPERLDAG